MDTNTVFRTKTEPVVEKETPAKPADTSTTTTTDIEVPYLDYESGGHPFVVDHFKLGDTWNDPVGGFPKEVAILEDYIQGKVKSGEIANSQSAVKELLKSMEKVTNVSKEERSLIKVETLAAYIEFLNKTDTLKGNLRRYNANT